MESRKVILHVDLNSFFATAEQQANPFLRNKPVGIIKAKGRTCVIAASVEAKKYGVKTGTNVFEAKKFCPQIILVSADFDKYADITYRFINICKSYSPVCEVFSLDECFIDLTESQKFWPNITSIAFDLKQRLRNEIGDYITCSIGVSRNRLLSKLASSQIKPDGLFFIDENNTLEILDKSSLMDVCGIGWGLYNHLIKIGIDNFPKLRLCSLEFLTKHFGPFWSLHLYNISRGIDYTQVTPFDQIEDAKSVGRTYTTHRNLYKKEEIARLIRNLCEETAFKARRMGLSGRYVALTLRGGEVSKYGHKTLKNYISDGKTLFDLCLDISKNWPFGSAQGKPVRFCGVTLAMLASAKYLTISLFPDDRRRHNLIRIVDQINLRFGDYTIFPGQLLGMAIVRPEVNGYFGDKNYYLLNH